MEVVRLRKIEYVPLLLCQVVKQILITIIFNRISNLYEIAEMVRIGTFSLGGHGRVDFMSTIVCSYTSGKPEFERDTCSGAQHITRAYREHAQLQPLLRALLLTVRFYARYLVHYRFGHQVPSPTRNQVLGPLELSYILDY